MFIFNDVTVHSLHPIDLYRKMDEVLSKDGKDWLGWEPETVLQHLKVPRTAQEAVDKVLAVQAIAAHVELACESHEAFEALCNSFCNYSFIVGESQPAGIEECFYTVKQIKAIADAVHKIKDGDVIFYGEIPGYIAAVAKLHSHRVLPVPLWFAQDILDFIYPNTDIDLASYKNVAEEIDKADLSTLDELEDTDNNFINWLIGCYRYDPTITA